MAHLAFIFCCAVWGSMFIVLERVTHSLAPVEIALWRFGGGAAVLGAIWWWRQGSFRLSRADWAIIVFIALAFNLPPQLIMPYLVGQGFGHSFFGPMVAPIPLITILVSIPLLGVLPTPRQLVGVLGGLACVWLIVDDGFDRGMSPAFIALALAIPVSSAVCNTVIKWKLSRVPAVPLTTAILVVAGLSLVPLQFSPPAMETLHVAAPVASPVTAPTPLTYVYLFILGVIGTGVSTAAFVWMILQRGPLFAGMTTYVVPVLSLLWGAWDHERISPQQMAAIAGVLAMVALVQSGSRRTVATREPAIAPDALAEAIAPATLAAEPPLAVVPATSALPNQRAAQPESQVA